MSLDLTALVSGALGSLIAMVGSIIVAFLYIRNQNNLEKTRRINEQIQKTYIEEGILPIQEAISEYAISSIFLIMDYRNEMVRKLKNMKDEKLFLKKIEEIKDRPTVKILIQREYSSAIDSFPYLRRFGGVIYGTIIKIFQNWSELISDTLEWENMERQISQAGLDEVERSLGSILHLIQETQIYLLKRLDNLKDYIWEHDFETYSDFINILQSEKYKSFIADLEKFNQIYTNIMSAFKDPDSQKRIDASNEFNAFMKNVIENPFKQL